MPPAFAWSHDTPEIRAAAESGEFSVARFSGTNAELQAFLERVWSDAYSGRMAFPVWSEEYLDWQFARQPDQPDRRLAVLCGGEVVAVLLGVPYRFRGAAGQIHGAHWSWLSVDAACRGQGLAALLDRERMQLELDSGSDLVVSYRFTGSKHSLAEKPSSKFPLKQFARKMSFWVRALDLRKLKAWNVNSVEAFCSGLVAPFIPEVRAGNECRLVQQLSDLQINDCVDLLSSQNQQHALAIDWDVQSLRHQLNGSRISQTVVAEVSGTIKGFINFHVLPFQGRTREPIAIIDIMAMKNLSSTMQRALLKAALVNMRQQGAILAMKLRCGDEPKLSLLRTGFIPRLPDSVLVLQWTKQLQTIDRRKAIHVLWR